MMRRRHMLGAAAPLGLGLALGLPGTAAWAQAPTTRSWPSSNASVAPRRALPLRAR